MSMARMSFGQGMNDSVQHVFGGIIYAAIVNVIIGSKLVSPNYTLYFGLLNAVLIAALVLALGKRGIIYLIGWLIGIGLLVYGGILGTGLIGLSELIIDLGIPLGFIGLKIYLWSIE